MNRMSSLPASEFCGLAPRIGAEHGAGMRSTVMGSAFHAKCSGIDEAAWAMKLTPDERAEISEWHPVGDWAIDGLTLRYADAEKELSVSLRSDGSATPTDADPEAMTVGHIDIGHDPPGNTVYIEDIKRSTFTVPDGASSLQLMAYGTAYAALKGKRYFVPSIWAAVEGERLQGPRIDTHDFAFAELWSRIEHASKNRGEAARGAHCMGCYSRFYCPEHLLPAAVAAVDPELAKVALGGPPLDRDGALRLLLTAKALDDLSKSLTDAVRAYATQKGLVDGRKRYAAVQCQGRESGLSVAELRKRGHGDLVRRGAPYDMWKWVNV